MHRSYFTFAVFLSAFLAAGNHAVAQTAQPSDQAKAIFGTWEISNADRDKICLVTFRPELAPGGLKLDFDQACGETFALTKEVTAWTIGRDALRFIDSRGRTILELDEVEKGIFEGERLGEGRYFMQTVASAPPVRTAEQMVGDWAVMRSDKQICVVTLSDTAMADRFELKLKPGCDAFVSSFNPTSWRMERGELVLLSARGAWRFEEGDQVTWRQVPDRADSVWLLRQ